MENIILPPVCDFVSLAAYYGSAVKGLTFTLKVIKEVATPRAFANTTPEDLQWVQCGLLWVQVDHVRLRTNCNNAAVQSFLSAAPEYLLGYGCVTVCLKKGVVIDSNNQNVLSNFITVKGNLSADKYQPGFLYINKWQQTDFGWQVQEAAFADKNAVVNLKVPQGLQILYENICSLGQSMNTLIRQARIFDTRDLPCAGMKDIVVTDPILLRPETRVEIDETHKIIGRVTDDWKQESLFTEDEYVTFTPKTIVNPTGVTTVKGRTYYNRDTFYRNDKFIDGLQKLLDTCDTRVQGHMIPLSQYEWYDTSGLRDKICTAILGSYANKPETGFGTTGRMLFNNVMTKAMQYGLWSNVTKEEIKGYNNTHSLPCMADSITVEEDEAEYVLSSLQNEYSEAHDFLTSWKSGSIHAMNEQHLPFVIRENKLIWLFIAEILKLKYDFLSLVDSVGSLFRLIFKDPYALIYYSSNISILDMDKLAMFAGVFNKPELESSRCIAYIHSIMIDEDNSVVNCRTCVPLKEIQTRLKYGYAVNATMQKQLAANKGYAVDKNMLTNATYYLGRDKANFVLPETEAVRSGTKTVYLREANLESCISYYTESGLGIVYQNMLIDYLMLSRELAIYNQCKQLSEEVQSEVSSATIQSVISKYEEERHIVLEEKQRKALENNSRIFAVVGSAGTGKTTVAEAIIQKWRATGVTREEIVLLAPTGCAANRMKRVTGYNARTIHSYLGLGIEKDISMVNRVRQNETQVAPKIVIVDECSMITLDVMYSLLTKLDLSAVTLYLLGDIAQLPGIGFGKPFVNMLKYIPCVTLDVSKRAAESSLITRNANVFLDTESNDEMANGADFRLFNTDTISVQQEIVNICKHHLKQEHCDGLPELYTDDIQVVTPVKRDTYTWGAGQLNTILRNVFNPDYLQGNCVTFTQGTETREFYEGDKVINLKNHPFCRRYEEVDKGYFEPMEETGITNGDIGRIKKIVPGCDVSFAEDYRLSEKKRNQLLKSRQEMIYLFVEYTDIDLTTHTDVPYLVAYPVRKISDNYVNNVDLSELDLAYAITVHKMEGAQAQIIVMPMFGLGYSSDFISSNMVYTGITRAQKFCYLLGDVQGAFSALSKAKKTLILPKKLSIFDNY